MTSTAGEMSSEKDRPFSYGRLGRVIARVLRIPTGPAEMPVDSGELIKSFHPSPKWLRLRRLQIIGGTLVAILANVAVFLLQMFVGNGFNLSIPAFDWFNILFLVPVFLLAGGFRLITLRLQYDCTWYVLTERALRIRRGLILIHETTITYANIQNLSLQQGPLERMFSLSNIKVETAGGGGSGSETDSLGHSGQIQGVEDAESLRDLIMTQVRLHRSGGLGEAEPVETPSRVPEWAGMSEILVQIRNDLRSSS
jgi:membrane protein YdbS with pleckstrin-like domain